MGPFDGLRLRLAAETKNRPNTISRLRHSLPVIQAPRVADDGSLRQIDLEPPPRERPSIVDYERGPHVRAIVISVTLRESSQWMTS